MVKKLGYVSFASWANEDITSQPWHCYIRPEITCTVEVYSFGERIIPPSNMALGIVASGTVEICDDSVLDEYYRAYRPIRILKPGHSFGDFRLVDHVLNVCPMADQESWQLYAGRRSVLILQRVKDLYLFGDDQSPKTPSPHAFINRTSSGEEVTVIYLHYNEISFQKNVPLFNEFLYDAWRKVTTYRSDSNNYNRESFYAFRSKAVAAWDNIGSMRTSKENAVGENVRVPTHKTGKTATKVIQPIFLDALFETLGRAAKGGPLFAHQKNHLPKKCWDSLLNFGKIDPEKVLTACDVADSKGPFYYPMDLHNYEINFSCVNLRIEGDAKIALGLIRDSKSELRPRDFFRAMLNAYIDNKLQRDYPYIVKCIDTECLDGRMLLLEFQVK